MQLGREVQVRKQVPVPAQRSSLLSRAQHSASMAGLSRSAVRCPPSGATP